MSLIIKGVDMPKNCAECPILQIGSLEHYCPLAKESMWSIDAESGKHSNCPLSEIPTPHGRLIDADELYEPMERDLYAGIGCDPTSIAAITISEAPTIIEAEVSE
ncbi:MAG: hypothetical protein IIY54_10045 [Ruminococcus sp.]|nr:hypothetical protein [Ruminococcus sp.]